MGDKKMSSSNGLQEKFVRGLYITEFIGIILGIGIYFLIYSLDYSTLPKIWSILPWSIGLPSMLIAYICSLIKMESFICSFFAVYYTYAIVYGILAILFYLGVYKLRNKSLYKINIPILLGILLVIPLLLFVFFGVIFLFYNSLG